MTSEITMLPSAILSILESHLDRNNEEKHALVPYIPSPFYIPISRLKVKGDTLEIISYRNQSEIDNEILQNNILLKLTLRDFDYYKEKIGMEREVYDKLNSMYQRLGPFKYPQIIYDPDIIEEFQYTSDDIRVVAVFAKPYPSSNLLFGIKVTQKGVIVEGRFHQDRLNVKGYSRIMGINGEWEIGNIINAKLNGYSSKCFNNNEILNGVFKEDKLDGNGEHFTKNCYKSSGKFIQNKREGIHEFTKVGTE